jgi:DNA polymerase III subunit gamma/tau
VVDDAMPEDAEPADSLESAPVEQAGEPYQSLYRRYRPQRFADVRGQEHVTRALLNSVREGRVAHAYLFSGPRGTGKTSTARILAMALNCENPDNGEPCGVCDSCVAIRRGSSLDVHELDAASNRKLDEMRDLLSRVALGTSGRWKVYIVDEVHQLTSDAASALLKTLEEPPGHVIFVLATTDPQKVMPTIRSRTQHFEFHLLGSDVLAGLLGDINTQAGLGVAPEAIDLVVRRGHGSARDALSVLDQVAAAGSVDDETAVVADIVEALADRDVGRVLVAVAECMSAGRDPRRLAVDLLDHLRNGFLASQARGLVLLPDDAAAEVEAQAHRLGLATLVRAMEIIGQAATDMRDAVDPRVAIEVALVRIASPAADAQPAALLARIEQLEQRLEHGGLASADTGGASSAAGSLAEARAAVSGTAVPGAAVAAAAELAAGDRPAATAAPQAPEVPAVRVAEASEASQPQAAAIPSSPRPVETAPAAEAEVDRRPPRPAVAPRPTMGDPPPTPRPTLGARPRRTLAQAPPSAGSTPPPSPGRSADANSRVDAAPAAAPATAPTAAGDAATDADAPSRPAPSGGAPQAAGPASRPAPPGRPAAGLPAGSSELPTRDELTKAWGDTVLPSLPARMKAYLALGRFLAVDASAAVYALPDQGLLARSETVRKDFEAALTAHFGRPVPLRLVLDDASAPPKGAGAEVPPPIEEMEEEDPDSYVLADLEDVGAAVVSPEQRLLDAFPGAEEVTP